MRAAPGLAALAAALGLAACVDNGDDAAAPEPIEPAALCVNSQCGQARQIVDLPDLENLAFSADGRLFVSGQQNLYEIVRGAGGGYSARALLAGGSGCSGIAAGADYLYGLCQSGTQDLATLYVLDLHRPDAAPELAFALSGMTLPNGLVVGPDSDLYVTDGPIAANPKIVRLKLDPADPRRVLAQETWLDTFPDYPNGLALRGRSLYTTLYGPATGRIARIDIGADGTAGAAVTVDPRGSIMDDLNVAGDSLLATDWQQGRIFQLALDGSLLQQTDAGSFAQPSSVDVARPPLFDGRALLVTERYTGRGLWLFEPRP